MRCCSKCKATEKEVMLQTVSTIDEYFNTDKFLMCINCIYQARGKFLTLNLDAIPKVENINYNYTMISIEEEQATDIDEEDFKRPMFVKGIKSVLAKKMKEFAEKKDRDEVTMDVKTNNLWTQSKMGSIDEKITRAFAQHIKNKPNEFLDKI